MANSDAMAFTRYLGALGLEVGADHLLHCLGMALSGPPADSADELVPALNALSGPGGAIETVRCSYTSADIVDALSPSLSGTVSRMSAIG